MEKITITDEMSMVRKIVKIGLFHRIIKKTDKMKEVAYISNGSQMIEIFQKHIHSIDHSKRKCAIYIEIRCRLEKLTNRIKK